ncbi:hypothetical protein ABZX92_43340 [Lentzea sp. NPDC006480]|uniref:hypothetical protein n=1 Tax=Lentzea sp. NPDC006480 TaxID=3157176 RepID=UPI0033A5B40E
MLTIGVEGCTTGAGLRRLVRVRTAEPALRFLDEPTTPPQELRLFAGMPAPVHLAAAGRLLSS